MLTHIKSNEGLRVNFKYSENTTALGDVACLSLSLSLSGFYRPGKPVTRKLLFLLNLSLTDQTQPQHRITHKTPAAMDEAHAAH